MLWGVFCVFCNGWYGVFVWEYILFLVVFDLICNVGECLFCWFFCFGYWFYFFLWFFYGNFGGKSVLCSLVRCGNFLFNEWDNFGFVVWYIDCGYGVWYGRFDWLWYDC